MYFYLILDLYRFSCWLALRQIYITTIIINRQRCINHNYAIHWNSEIVILGHWDWLFVFMAWSCYAFTKEMPLTLHRNYYIQLFCVFVGLLCKGYDKVPVKSTFLCDNKKLWIKRLLCLFSVIFFCTFFPGKPIVFTHHNVDANVNW